MMYGTDKHRAAIGSDRANTLRDILGGPDRVFPVACPVGELVSDPHTFLPGAGVVVEWSVMGDSRQTVKVCAECARGVEQ